MSKLLSLISAGTLALAANSFVIAADEPYPNDQSTQKETTPSQNETTTRQKETTGGPTETTPGNSDQKSAEYLAALKKCEALNDSGERQKCVDAAQKKNGQM
jgi:hypothetical protein